MTFSQFLFIITSIVKKLYFLTIAVLIVSLSAFSFVFADEGKKPDINAAIAKPQKKESSVKEPAFEIPDWVKRTNVAISAGSDERPKYFLETIQPLLGTQDKDVVFFNQSRISEEAPVLPITSD